MNDQPLIKLLTNPLEPSFAVVLILVGLYSWKINARQAANKNCLRSAKFARIAGWCYIAAGAGILLVR
ncbi:MAG: hypothetical protein RIN56_02900 [Sporomusaceae bacterium]|nr:hypothetical protein [Sporomusaceae bacterium]